VPIPWPELALARSRTRLRPPVAACSRAAIFRECIGSTRGSLAPLGRRTGGYAVPSLTLWYEVGALGEDGPHEEPAVAAPLDGEAP
jgi:hypothetical protein